MKAPKAPKGKSGKKSPLNRKTQCIAHCKLWVRKGHHKRVVFFGATDKKGRVFIKTIGNLRKQDLMQNKYGRVVSKRVHAHGKAMFKHIKLCFDARQARARELGLTGFLKAKKNGTYEQRQLCLVMQVAAKISKRPDANVEEAVAAARSRISEGDAAAGGGAASTMKRPSGASSSNLPAQALGKSGSSGGRFARDTKVVLHGLTSAEGRKINGKTGIILTYGIEQLGRYQIKLDKAAAGLPTAVGYDTPVVHIKPENVKQLDAKGLPVD